MNLLVPDTGPLNYLIQIECVSLLSEVASEVIIPVSVLNELQSELAPAPVRTWALSAPDWLNIVEDPGIHLDPTSPLSKTDMAVIKLARLKNSVLLMDEINGRDMARSLEVPVIGTVGILLLGAELGLVDFPSAFAKLQKTNIFLSPKIIQDAWTRFQTMPS